MKVSDNQNTVQSSDDDDDDGDDDDDNYYYYYYYSGYRSGGKEVITKYSTDMATDGEFFTDLNGRETLKRRCKSTKFFVADLYGKSAYCVRIDESHARMLSV